MRGKAPKTIKEWIREVEWALEEAIDILNEDSSTLSEDDLNNLYKMAPSISAIARGIEDRPIKDEMLSHSLANVMYVHKKIPDYKSKYRRCFVHAYLDSMIYTKYISQSKAEKVIDLLEGKRVIEPH
jgi:hypothetical protein